MVADSLTELHAFAARLGLKREWFQTRRLPHYDLTTRRAAGRAVEAGAVMTNSRDIITVARKLKTEASDV